jgi:hypothetical protein
MASGSKNRRRRSSMSAKNARVASSRVATGRRCAYRVSIKINSSSLCRRLAHVLRKTRSPEGGLVCYYALMVTRSTYRVKGNVWLYPGEMAAWHFVNVEKKISETIKAVRGKNVRGFGSIPVRATIGKTSWDTSIFPDKRSGTYLLPLKASVRRAEDVNAGDAILFVLASR